MESDMADLQIESDIPPDLQIESDIPPDLQIESDLPADLPDVIILDILLSLPVKSLARFRCVSKSWLSLISSPQFVKTHLQLSSRRADYSNHRVLFNSYRNCFNLRQCSISSLMSKASLVFAYGVDYPNKSMYNCFTIKVVGSCNGLICIEYPEKDIFLWNPSTGESKRLPLDVEMMKDYYTMWGFGYIECEDDYKVVGDIVKHPDGLTTETTTKIYSLRSDSWKTIETTPGFAYEGRLASEKLHFMEADLTRHSCTLNIVSLDLKSEAFGILKQPEYGKDCSCPPYLGTIGCCLSVFCSYERSRGDLWVMKEYGSWTKLISVPYFDNDPIIFGYLNPLLIMPNGDILFFYQDSIAVYNPKDECFNHSQLSNFPCCSGADIYVESLVPL